MMNLKTAAGALLCLLALSAATFTTQAQNGTMTPYSRFGYGVLRDRATSAQTSMGGVGYAMQSGRQINAMNPASYAVVDSLTFLFDLGLDVSFLWQNETVDGKELSDDHIGGGLDYVNMQFPVGRRLGMSVGLVPFSSVGYSFGDLIANGVASREGSGSITELYAGIGGRIFKGFTLGVDFSYMFGTLINDNYATVGATGSRAVVQSELTVRDWNMTAGAQYSFRPSAGNIVTLGLTWRPAKTLLGHAATYYYVENLSNPEELDPHKLRGNYSLPSTWGAGINLRHWQNWMLEADFTYQPWKDVKYRGIMSDVAEPQEFANRWKIAVGGQWVPNPRGGYGSRLNYRLGAYYNHDYLVVKGNNVREYGVSAGVGFPVPTYKTTVSLGLQWKHRQAAPLAMVREDYLTITLGVNFNEMWFRQSKIY